MFSEFRLLCPLLLVFFPPQGAEAGAGGQKNGKSKGQAKLTAVTRFVHPHPLASESARTYKLLEILAVWNLDQGARNRNKGGSSGSGSKQQQ